MPPENKHNVGSRFQVPLSQQLRSMALPPSHQSTPTATSGRRSVHLSAIIVRRYILVAAAIGLFSGSSIYFFTHPAYPDPYASPTLLSWDWFASPIEFNAPARLTLLNQNLDAVAVTPNADGVWIGGGDATLLHSTTDGWPWREQELLSELQWAELEDAVVTRAGGRRADEDAKRAAAESRRGDPALVAFQAAAGGDAGNGNQMAEAKFWRSVVKVEFPLDSRRGWAVVQALPLQPTSAAPPLPPTGLPPPSFPAYTAVLHTEDGGATWQVRAVRDGRLVRDIQFLDEQRGWMIEEDWSKPNSVVQTTRDGGRTWLPETVLQDVFQVQFVDADHGWLLQQIPAAEVPARPAAPSEPKGSRVPRARATMASYIPSVEQSRIVAEPVASVLLATSDGGRNWERIPLREPMTRVHFLDARTGWAISDISLVFRTSDGGRTWTPSVLALEPDFYQTDIHFVDANQGWVLASRFVPEPTLAPDLLQAPLTTPANRDGIVFATLDGGQTWRQQARVGEPLLAVRFRDRTHGWAAGWNGTILHTSDAGQTWARQTRSPDEPAPPSGTYWWLPGPGYYLAIAICGLLLVPLYVTPREVLEAREQTEATIADRFASDRPLRTGDRDYLGFQSLALALSRFLRNENTVPPVTIAITGDWGTGKSSLMNLVQADLVRHSFRPVWFNAWHHQKEEQLLASLLENIRSQAVPMWTDPWTRIRFHFRLLLHKGVRYLWLIPALALIGLLVGQSTWVQEAIKAVTSPAAAAATGGETSAGGAVQNVAASGTASGASIPRALAFFSGLLGLAAAMWRGMTAFGVNPASLMVSVSGAAKIGNLGEQLSFRHRFAREFRDVTWALQPRTMVILIDDLDRCQPKNVLEVLEAINFLVSSGDCYVLLGMAPQRVARCVGLGFADVAEELLPEDDEQHCSDEDQATRSRRRRERYARQYLEKLVNIEVPVPPMTSDASRNIMVAEMEDNVPDAPAGASTLAKLAAARLRSIWFRIPYAARFALLGVPLLVALLVGFHLASSRNLQPTPPARPNGAPPAAAESSSAPAGSVSDTPDRQGN
ncbi:MAG: hypothetical protein J5I93_11915 [Pirellulaceae bacterium]|nr:hypothetical protein [Pirellulaceae bacterium]